MMGGVWHTSIKQGLTTTYAEAWIGGALTLKSGEVYDWLVVSRAVSPVSLPEVAVEHAKEQALKEMAKDAHPALTAARLRGGRHAGLYMPQIKEAIHAKL